MFYNKRQRLPTSKSTLINHTKLPKVYGLVLIRKEYPSALYIHCSAHNLNLSVPYTSNIQGIRNTMEEMITWTDVDTSSKTNQLLLALKSSEFNVAFEKSRVGQFCLKTDPSAQLTTRLVERSPT
ncbi:Hypothetical protein CINCED_3A003085 [Cinara cedri]|uniref:Uncharacterized protein n=1 Tax=Cinara cedri TaxID=506608 RepID=A0A5E4MPJ3_9HEMI|nr:Hypothetical protein CINCED_3A003085 [Cinara cedri]